MDGEADCVRRLRSLGWLRRPTDFFLLNVGPYRLLKFAQGEVGIIPQCAFPDNDDTPAKGNEGIDGSGIPGCIGGDFGCPELRSGSRHGCIPTFDMTMPEAAMDKYGYLPTGQD